jgi:hypothetical protein
VELGGWNPLFSFWNPPPRLLEQEVQRFPQWLVWHALLSPELALEVSSQAVGNDSYLVRAVVSNRGWLPTYITKQAANKKLVRGMVCEIALPDDALLIQGQRRLELGQLEGRAHKPASTFGWAGTVTDPTDNRAKAEWVVQAKPGTKIEVTARHPRAGRVKMESKLS